MEELSLKWDEHHPAVISVFEELLAKGTLVDCTIAADGQYVKAHKVVLAACSPYFELLFSQENEKNPIVVLKDMKFQELKYLIDFVYRGQVKLPEDQLDAFVSAAESLQIKGLSGQQKKQISEKSANKTVASREGCSSPIPRKRRRSSRTEPNEDSRSEPGNDSSTDSNIHENFMPTPVSLGAPSTSAASSSSGIASHSVTTQRRQGLPESRFPSHNRPSASPEQVLPDVSTVVKTEPIEEPTEPVEEVFLSEPKNEEYVDDLAMLESGAGSSDTRGGTSQQNTNNYPVTGAVERFEEIPEMNRTDAAKPVEDLLPSKSKESYLKEYENFKEWRKEKTITNVCEDVMLAYFTEKSEKYKSSSLWAQYSMLKATMNIYENIDMTKYMRLIAFLRDKHMGYEAKKTKVLTKQQIVEFLKSAPDEIYLMEKVAVVFGVSGACRCDELYNINVDYVQDKGNLLVVSIPRTNTNKKRVFTIMADDEMNGVDLYRKYVALRPKKTGHPSLFVSMRRGKCTVQRVGINSFYKIAKTVATYLKLEEPETYTGHSLRRSSATLLAESGTEIMSLKSRGGWRSSNVSEEYVEDSVEQRGTMTRGFIGGEVQASTSSVEGNIYYSTGYSPESSVLEFGRQYF